MVPVLAYLDSTESMVAQHLGITEAANMEHLVVIFPEMTSKAHSPMDTGQSAGLKFHDYHPEERHRSCIFV